MRPVFFRPKTPNGSGKDQELREPCGMGARGLIADRVMAGGSSAQRETRREKIRCG